MTIHNKTESLLLFLGDAAILYSSLWATLLLRTLATPAGGTYSSHIVPFSMLFAVWVLVFFASGLYAKHTLVLKSKLPTIIFHAQLTNALIAVAFFYFIPYFGITPKLNLFIFLGISSPILLAWRLYGHPLLGFRKKQPAMLIGSGEEMKELLREVNQNARYNLKFVSSVDLDALGSIDFQSEIISRIYSENISVVVVHFRNDKVEPILPHLYNLIFSHVRFVDMHRVYEDLFDRVPFSLLQYSWFLENISLAPNVLYDVLKRGMDIVLSALLLIPSLIVFPVIALCIYLEDRREIFGFQDRVGQNNTIVRLIKFRTMLFNDNGAWHAENENRVTRIGAFLRKTRLDELPQLINVLRGDISLIGPRPEFPQAVKKYEAVIPYYGIRHLIKPGLSGWAQIHHERHPHHGVDVRETKNKVSYDLYYIKNRSFMLDVKIAVKTVRTMLARSGT